MSTRTKHLTPLTAALVATLGIGAASAATLDAGNIGWYRDDGRHAEYNFNFATGLNSGSEYRSFFTFDLSGLGGQTFTSATLHLWNSTSNNGVAQFGYDSADATETLNLYDVAASVTNLSNKAYGTNAGDAVGQTTFADLGTGTLLGTVTVVKASSGVGSYVDVNFNAAGLSALNAAAGSFLALGSAVGSLGGTANQTLFSAWSNNGSAYQSIEIGRAQLVYSAVPEPASMLLMGSGLAALGALVRRRRTTVA